MLTADMTLYHPVQDSDFIQNAPVKLNRTNSISTNSTLELEMNLERRTFRPARWVSVNQRLNIAHHTCVNHVLRTLEL
jgi:hypothetical protein